MVTCSVPPQLQFVNNITEWKVTLQREGFAKTVVTMPFTVPTTQLTVNRLLPATRYTVWVSVKAGSAEGPLSEAFNVTTQEEGETWQKERSGRLAAARDLVCQVRGSLDLVYCQLYRF